MKVSCIIIKYNIMTERSFTVSTTKKTHFRLHVLRLSLSTFQNTAFFCAKKKQDWERIEENLFISDLLSFKMLMRVLKILSIMSSQHAHLNAVNSDKNFKIFFNSTQRQNRDSEKEVDIHDSEKLNSDKSVNIVEASSNEKSMMIHH